MKKIAYLIIAYGPVIIGAISSENLKEITILLSSFIVVALWEEIHSATIGLPQVLKEFTYFYLLIYYPAMVLIALLSPIIDEEGRKN